MTGNSRRYHCADAVWTDHHTFPVRGLHQYGNFGPFCANGPRIHEFLKEMNREVLSHYDIITVGEMPDVTIELSQQYTGEDEDELQMVFQFEHMGLDRSGPMGRWSKDRAKLSDLRRCLSAWQT